MVGDGKSPGEGSGLLQVHSSAPREARRKRFQPVKRSTNALKLRKPRAQRKQEKTMEAVKGFKERGAEPRKEIGMRVLNQVATLGNDEPLFRHPA
jgi:hypothetical protein